ncbi:hypothetical protein GCM10027343_16610 [Noviherbaspirillum agri]
MPSGIVIESANRSDTRHACRGAEIAVRFLSSHGFTIPPVTIKIVDAMPENIPESALGAYSRSRNEVFILAFPAFLDRSEEFGLFNIPVDESAYRAVVAHEVAHAIAFHNFRVPPTLLGQEYIAFVVLFNALEKSQCDDVLWHYDYDEDWLKYPAILYLTDQLAFGAHAYWHFQRPENGDRFFRQILEGKALSLDE